MKKLFTTLITLMLLTVFTNVIYAQEHGVEIVVNSKNSVTIVAEDTSPEFESELIHASYTDGVLNKVNVYNLVEDNIITVKGVTVTMTEDIKQGDKLMVWNSLSGMKPYGEYTVESLPEISNQPVQLKTEALENPLGIDSEKPKFSWKLTSTERDYTQSAYRILVASSIEKLNNDEGDMWDSGKVTSSEQYAVVYNGNALSSITEYYWKVMIYDGDGNPSDWSETASFETALLNQDEWTAKLIGGYNVRMVRNSITIPKDKEIVSARAYASSPGYFELHINGEVIGDHVIDPVQTNPDMRLLYPIFDVTDKLTNGENAVGAMLGYGGVCGLTGTRSDVSNHTNDDGSRYFTMQLCVKYSDGTSDMFITDESWKGTSGGPVVFDELYGGETYDATKEIDGWDKAGFAADGWSSVTASDIGSKIMAAQLVPIKAAETITPVGVRNVNGAYVFDLGKNISGRPVIKVSGARGTTLEMHFGEKVYSDGRVDYRSTRHDWTCKYTLKGDGIEEWSPSFAISGFRYISVSGSSTPLTADNVKAELITSDVQQTGSFTSSSEKLNKIHDMYLLSQLANISTGVPVDCPHRERLGWLGDAMLITNALSRNYDISNMYSKWFDDMNDEIVRSGTGVWRNHIPNPSHYDSNPTPFDVPWYSANIEIPWTIYEAYGDVTMLEKNYDRMAALITYLQGKTSNNIITETGAWGDWVSVLGKYNLTNSYLGTGYYYRCVDVMVKTAEVLGKSEDKAKYEALAADIKNAINAKWLIDGSYYDTDTQSANAMALDFGIVPEETEDAVLNSLTEDIIKRDYHMTTGVTGTFNIFRALSKYERDDIIYNIMIRESYPGYGYMLYNGATTPWEFWNNATDSMSSWNHVFLTGPAEGWLNNNVVGITPLAVGYKEIKIKPAVVGDLEGANGKFESVHGLISSDWSRSGNIVTMNVTIPANTTAEIYIPTLGADSDKVTITEGASAIWQNNAAVNDDIEYKEINGDYIVFKVGSGDYSFTMTADENASLNSTAVHYDTLDRTGTIIQAESYSTGSGIVNNSYYINGLDPWDYVEYSNVDMTDVSDIQVSLKANWGSDKKAIDFRLDSPTGEIISTLYMVGTKESKAEIYHIESAQCIRTSGVHKLYMTFRGGEGICDIDYIKLIKSKSSGTVIAAEPVTVYTANGASPVLPSSVTVYLSDNTAEQRRVAWTDNTEGTIEGTDVKAQLIIKTIDKPYITAIPEIAHTVFAGDFSLPLTVKADYSDNSKRDVLVAWEAVNESMYSDTGEITVYGSVEGTDIKAQAVVSVQKAVVPDITLVEQVGDTVEIGWDWNGAESEIGKMSYEVQRSGDNINLETIGTSSGYWTKTAYFIDNSLPRTDKTYYYRVRAVSSTGAKSEYTETETIDYNYIDLGKVVSTGTAVTTSGNYKSDANRDVKYVNDGDIHADRYWLSKTNKTADAVEWITIDLGQNRDISSVKLFSQRNNIGMPVRFKIEVSDDSNFVSSTIIADYLNEDYPKPDHYAMQYFIADEGTNGRYVRLYATKLDNVWTTDHALAFEEIQVCSPYGSVSNENLLVDGSIEEATAFADGKWKPSGGAWTMGLGESVTIDTENVSDNSTKSAKITNAALYQAVALESGESYKLSFDIYVNSGFNKSKLTWGVFGLRSDGYVGDIVCGFKEGQTITQSGFDESKRNEWQHVETEFTCSSTALYAVEFMYTLADGINIDNMSLVAGQ